MALDGVSIGSACATVDETVVTSVVKGTNFLKQLILTTVVG